MVRLKGKKSTRRECPAAISIPHGTIKSPRRWLKNQGGSKFQFHMVRLKATQLKDVNPGSEFQFHMVRLKEGFHSKNCCMGLISIPHGTIKRV